jgi:hypothetical protein
MRKLTFLMLFVILVGVMWSIFLVQRDSNMVTPPLIEEKFIIGRLDDTIDKQEAEKIPPNERWHEIKDLKETIAIDMLCDPSFGQIVDPNTVQEIVDLFQDSKYVEVTEYPKREPDVKLYFRKKDGYIMAGRLYISEGVINSPEGPVIKIDSMAVNILMENTDCNGHVDRVTFFKS